MRAEEGKEKEGREEKGPAVTLGSLESPSQVTQS